MLIFDLRKIGDRLLTIRKGAGLTQAEVAELAGLSDRTYAEIERGCANMRVQTLMQICKSLRITPDDILTENNEEISAEEITKLLDGLNERKKLAALKLLTVLAEEL